MGAAMGVTPHRFLQYLDATGRAPAWYEVVVLEGQVPTLPAPQRAVVLAPRGQLVQRLKGGVRVLVKAVVRLIYLLPVLVVIKLVSSLVWPREAEYLTFAFVVLVVVFFALLNAYLWLAVGAYLLTRRGERVVVPPFDPAAHTPFEPRSARRFSPLAARQGGGAEVLCVRGRVVPVRASFKGGAVLRDLWVREGSPPWRLVEGYDFAVVSDEEEPTICCLGVAPLLIDQVDHATVRESLPQLTAEAQELIAQRFASASHGGRAEYLDLRAGDRVEVLGQLQGSVPNVERFELAGRACALGSTRGPDAAYRARAGRAGRLVAGTAAFPLWVRTLGKDPT